MVDVDWTYLESTVLHVAEVHGELVLVVEVCGHARRHEERVIIRLEIGGLIGVDRVGDRVGPVESV